MGDALSTSQDIGHRVGFKQRLLDRGKKKMQVNIAIMRKLLTAAWATVKDPQRYDASRLHASVEAD